MKAIIPIKAAKAALRYLKSTNLRKTSYSQIKKRTDILVRCGFMTVVNPAGHDVIYRGRLWNVKGKPFVKVQEISYRLKRKSRKIILYRASTNKFQVFYGAIGTPELTDAQIAAIVEVGQINKKYGRTNEYIAIGQWFVKKDFMMATLGVHSELAKSNSQAQKMKQFQEDLSVPHSQAKANKIDWHPKENLLT